MGTETLFRPGRVALDQPAVHRRNVYCRSKERRVQEDGSVLRWNEALRLSNNAISCLADSDFLVYSPSILSNKTPRVEAISSQSSKLVDRSAIQYQQLLNNHIASRTAVHIQGGV